MACNTRTLTGLAFGMCLLGGLPAHAQSLPMLPGAPGITVGEIQNRMLTDPVAYEKTFDDGLVMEIRGYSGVPFGIDTRRAVFINKRGGFSSNSNVQCNFKAGDTSGFSDTLLKLKTGTPIVVRGTFTPATPYWSIINDGIREGKDGPGTIGNVGIRAVDCEIIGTWDPTFRELSGAATQTVSVVTMLEAAKNNQLAFNQDYMGKRLNMTGTVTKVVPMDDGSALVVVRHPSMQGMSGGVSCRLSSSQIPQAAKLSIGGPVKMVGTIAAAEMGAFNIKDCELI